MRFFFKRVCNVSVQNKSLKNNANIVERTFVRDDGKATLICPKCNSLKIIPVGQYRERQHNLQVRCSCSHAFKISLDFRQSFRRPTVLSGVYNLFPPASGGGQTEIKNISLGGICFGVKGSHSMQVGQKGRIDFILDNKKKSPLKKEFIIRSVTGNTIGCEFKQDQAFEKELGFYLRFGA